MKSLISNVKIATQNRALSALMPSLIRFFFIKPGVLIMLLIFIGQTGLTQDLIEQSNNLPEPLRQEAENLINNSEYQWPVHDIRIRIFGGENLHATIDESNFEVNRFNDQLFLLQSTIKNEKIIISYTKGGITKTINWDPSIVDEERYLMIQFLILISINHDLNFQLNYDPATLLIVPPNSILELNISYEHCLIFNDTQLKQERIVQECLVDADGIITLPVFYESRNSNVSPAIRDSDANVWFDAQSNSYKVRVSGLTYHQVEKKITDFYHKRIGDNSQVTDITVRITPEKYFSTIRVNHKRNCYELAYSNTTFGEFFADETVRARIRLRKKFIKGIIFSRPNTLGTAQKREARYHPKRDFKKERLYPGDIIYLK